MEPQEIGRKVVKLLNQIRDNLWLGDVKEVSELITKSSEILSSPELQRFQKSFEEIRQVFKDVKEECERRYKEIKGLNRKSLLADEFKKRIEEPFKLQEAIIGLLLLSIKNFEQLRDVIPPRKVIEKDLYRYVVLESPPKYEIRALINEGAEVNVEGLIRSLKKENFNVLPVSIEHCAFIAAFSGTSYIEIVVLPPRVNISLSLPLLTPSVEEAQRLGEMIMDSLLRKAP
jgi:hypothetical protein